MTRGSTATRPWNCPQVDEQTGWRCPAPGEHDTYSAYSYGCRSSAAKRDNRRYHKLYALGRNEPRRVDPTGIQRRIQACHLMGWTDPKLAAELGTADRVISQLRRGEYGSTGARRHAQWAPILERMAMSPAPFTPHSAKARNQAARKGYRPLLAWDDIDDPAEQAPPAPDLADQIAELASRGLNQLQVARKLDIGEKVVRRRWPEVTVSVDVNVVDAVRARRRHLLDCSDPEAETVVEAVFRGCLGEGWPKPAVKTAELLDVDYAVVELIRNRVAKRQAHQHKEAS